MMSNHDDMLDAIFGNHKQLSDFEKLKYDVNSLFRRKRHPQKENSSSRRYAKPLSTDKFIERMVTKRQKIDNHRGETPTAHNTMSLPQGLHVDEASKLIDDYTKRALIIEKKRHGVR